MTNVDHSQLSLKLALNLSKLLEGQKVIQKKIVVGVYAPIEKEPLWYLNLEGLSEIQTAFPAFQSGNMIFRLSRLNELVESSDFGVQILGPTSNAVIVRPDIILVPGLGFTLFGTRLGRGKGFYDKYLEANTALKIGIAFEMQIEKEIPKESHDIKMDFVVTDNEIYKT
jgi:5-formyltetrahydrofolate cyclo-ligase